jgi:imidazolonepropionase-like amidohydrolase
MLCALVVDRVITGDLSQENFEAQPRYVVYDTESGDIKYVSDTVPEGDIKLIHFPPNCTLLPGFIDCHVHLTIFTDDYQMDHLRLSSADKALRGLKAAQGLLQAGFTTVRSAGDADSAYPSFSIAKSISEGTFEGPRIVGAGQYISVTGQPSRELTSGSLDFK